MGGGVVYNAIVAKPGVFQAAVAYAPVSSDSVDNFNKWVRRDPSRSGAAASVIDRLGTPEAQPARWATTSARTYFDRITEPLLIHHGTIDEDCPLSWSRESVAALKAGRQDRGPARLRGWPAHPDVTAVGRLDPSHRGVPREAPVLSRSPPGRPASRTQLSARRHLVLRRTPPSSRGAARRSHRARRTLRRSPRRVPGWPRR